MNNMTDPKVNEVQKSTDIKIATFPFKSPRSALSIYNHIPMNTRHKWKWYISWDGYNRIHIFVQISAVDKCIEDYVT